jgi:hypothetical protein
MQPLNTLSSANDFNKQDLASLDIQNVVGLKISNKEKLKKTANKLLKSKTILEEFKIKKWMIRLSTS